MLHLPQKLEHRISALDKTDWSEATKDEVREVLTLEYTSSDESCYENDSDSGGVELTCYQVKHLPWERKRLTKTKKSLDAIYEKGLTRRVKQSRLPRMEHEHMSKREEPENFVEWAVRRVTPGSRGASFLATSRSSSLTSQSPAERENVLRRLHFSTPRSTGTD